MDNPIYFMRKISILIILFIGVSFSLFSQRDGFVTDLDFNNIRSSIQNAELAKNLKVEQSKTIISLPLPNGTDQNFKVVESPVLGKDLSARFPEIKSYLIQGVSDKTFHGRFSISSKHLTAVFYSPSGIIYLEPEESAENSYISYHTDGTSGHFECGVQSEVSVEKDDAILKSMNTLSNGAILRTYDMIIATTGEFYQANGNTDASVTAEVNNILTGINVFYENELSIRFNVVAINLLSNPATDGLDPNGNRTGDANSIINAYAVNNGINYDIGHVMHSGSGGGVAGLGVACISDRKSEGWSGRSIGSSIFQWVGHMGHEIGHQFSAAHTFYGTRGFCGGARMSGNGYEPGSGNTVMSYEGSCSSHNISPQSNTNYFHVHSLTQILNYAASIGNCSNNTSTGNNIPSVTVPATITIPKETPFYLNGTATDADGDMLTYCWEQYDTDNNTYPADDPAGDPANANTTTTRPLFRSFDPRIDSHRYFPQLSDVVAGTTTKGEILSSVTRPITMRLTVRDNVSGNGAFEYKEMIVNVDGNSNPFSVSTPNGGETLTAGNMISVSWNIAGTASYCNNVDILLSVDGGFNYPYLLAANTNNDGNASILIPAGVTSSSSSRIMIRCADNPDAYFFDISDNSFNINSSCIVPVSSFSNTSSTTYNQGQAINLNVTPTYFGNSLSTYTGSNFTASSLGVYNTTETGCSYIDADIDLLEFSVDASGTYTFFSPGFLSLFSLFEGQSIMCPDFLDSNMKDNGSNSYQLANSTFSITLTAGKIYTLAVTNFIGSTVGFSGPGNVVTATSNLPNNYNYTYIAVDQLTGLVEDEDPGANFTGLSAGTYDVYGVAYENDGNNSSPPNDVNPATLIGQNINTVQYGAYCIKFSGDKEVITVSNCTNIPFTTTWQTTTTNESITIPTNNAYTYNYSIDWGDGNNASNQTGNTTHTYATPGTYTVQICGVFPHFHGVNWSDRNKLKSVEQWGDIVWLNMYGAFWGCENLISNATDAPNLSNVTNMVYMFRNAISLNQDLSNWNTQNVTNMLSVFEGATNFNQDIGSWNTQNVTNMRAMFYRANNFNQDIGGWDTGKVTTMRSMFFNAFDFNQNLNSWNTQSIVNFSGMFENAISFNHNLNNWNTQSASDMGYMFAGATSFNGNISTWNTQNVTEMSHMLRGATSFDKDLSTWDIIDVYSMENMLSDCGMSTGNYDNTLIGWGSQNPPSRTLGAYGLKYCAAETQRQSLLNQGWIINSDNLDPNCVNGCLNSHSISNIPSGFNHTYGAILYITSDAIIDPGTGTDILFEAGNYIEMQPNFEVKAGALFEARIGGCSNNP